MNASQAIPANNSPEIHYPLVDADSPHALPAEKVLKLLGSGTGGLSDGEVKTRLASFGPNALPRGKRSGILVIFFHQFASPLIYILLAAAVASFYMHEWSDALFICVVLLLNAVIGTIQEYSAERSAEALQEMVKTDARVLRGGKDARIGADELVPGDIVLLESGDKVPADLRLVKAQNFEADESLLTGESMAVSKNSDGVYDKDTTLGDRLNTVFAGTLITRGRSTGVVTATGLHTEIGKLATSVTGKKRAKAPLIQRMEQFSTKIAWAVGAVVCVIFVIELLRGSVPQEIFLFAVALAVSAIPEGLPVALSIVLSIGMRRMAKRNVIIRRLVAAETLGSCTMIATDKTGTLTLNEMNVKVISLPDEEPWVLPEGDDAMNGDENLSRFHRLATAAALCNEGRLLETDQGQTREGDAVDTALLVMAKRFGLGKDHLLSEWPMLAQIPFESDRQYMATLNGNGQKSLFVKGAPEKVLFLCDKALHREGDTPIHLDQMEEKSRRMAEQGYRVLAIAVGQYEGDVSGFGEDSVRSLKLLGYVGMMDPLRPEAKVAVNSCRMAGVDVAMVTGDHPVTAFAIARDLGMADSPEQVVTGAALKIAEKNGGPEAVDKLVRGARVFARVEPQQKLMIVRSMIRNGHFVAVTGDGANDAPALKAAHVGVAMGKRGTDVARESAEIIITDDNFASIVNGITEGRIAYNNVRKVSFLLVSTGASEIVLFMLAVIVGIPMPLVATQLLWLNLVTNGIQDVALAFEPGEGGEMARPPRRPGESIFDRIMLERVLLSAFLVGGISFWVFKSLLDAGVPVFQARNDTLLLMVLFENFQAFNSRSETLSVFRHNPLRNQMLLYGTLIAQAIHIGAMYTPGLSHVLKIQPITLQEWWMLLGYASLILVAMEIYKWLKKLKKK